VPQRPLCGFNLHHVASVVQGMVAAPPQATRRSLLWLWQHECFRVFCDRIPEAHERGEFQRLLAQVRPRLLDLSHPAGLRHSVVHVTISSCFTTSKSLHDAEYLCPIH
jgi:hypothetical protein